MSELLESLGTFITALLDSLGIYGPLLGSVFILIESILPILPLSVFITLNFYAFGNIFGFFISYILTVIGCNLAFYISRRLLSNRIDYLTKRYDENKLLKMIKRFSEIKFHNLAVLMAFPFTPAFLINIVGGISEMSHKKFLFSCIISKPFMIYFWGYLGVTLIQSFTHPEYLVKIIIMLVVAYVVSKLISKKFDLE